PQRPGCRVIMALNQPDKGKLAEVMGKLSPAAREKIEHALANSQLSPVLNEIPQDLKAQLLAALPHEFLMEQMTAMMDHARNPSSEPAPTPIPSSASATPTGGNNLTLSGHQASMIANVLKNIINTTTGADADAGGDLSGLSQGEQMAVLAYSANVLTKGRKREGDHNDYQQNQQQQQQQPQKRPRTLDTSSRQPSRLEMLASGPPEFTQGSHF
ncbi:MAG: hypothetical protein EBS90_13065, partial [Betaproteobacteria bacterium]|nr:hypothetical protein [Betaproteobacteria bacterium]